MEMEYSGTVRKLAYLLFFIIFTSVTCNFLVFSIHFMVIISDNRTREDLVFMGIFLLLSKESGCDFG